MRDDYFSWPPGGLELSACAYCARKHESEDTCDAFPDGIPAAILLMKHDHRVAFPGDDGLLFEPKPGIELPDRLRGE